jgi:citrate synthase
MDTLRTATSLIGANDPSENDNSPASLLAKSLRLFATLPTVVALDQRRRHGQEPIAPRDDLGYAANFLYMTFGEMPEPEILSAWEASLILYAEHSFNASTFTARVIASTLSDLYSAVTGAIGALKGPLHGGANQDVIKILLQLSSEEAAVDWVKNTFARKAKIPGFGHRVYRVEDPRATHLRVLSEELGRRTGHEKLFRLSEAMERTVKAEKGLIANVDFYSASAYYSLGIPVDLFTPVFAVSRMSGWTAHTLEQYKNNRLIRPRAEYKGNPDGMPWIPMDQR